MSKLDGKSLDIVSQNIEKIKELFPEVFSEGKINFAKLQEELGTFAEDEAERYNFTWAGKSEAKRIAQTPSTGTLRPCKEESKDWDTTQNLYIEGDNLEVLKLLQKSYHKQVKMIYIDPPYNTGKDFVYKDNFKDNIKNYLQITGQVDSEGNRLSTNSDTNGRYHSDWLSMMYPRLKLARNLLKDDGVIFISIDDNEVVNLRKLCDEIYGEDNFVAELIWNCSTGGGIRPKHFSKTHEYVLIYAKSIIYLPQLNAPLSTDAVKQYKLYDDKGLYREKDFIFKNTSTNINQMYGIECPNGDIVKPKSGYIYRFIRETFDDAMKENLVVFKKTNNGPLVNFDGTQANWNIYIKKYLGDGKGAPTTSLPRDIVGIYNNGTGLIQTLFNGDRVFQNVKSVELLKYLIEMIATDPNDIILDFFSGSATTAQAVMQLNSEDGFKRKFICIQLPEITENSSEAKNAGYKNICEIGKERIRRAGTKIITDNPDKDLSNLDIGFKVLKLDSSNIKTWDSNFDNLEQNLLDSIENIKNDRTPQDLLYEILLKYGLNLTLPIEEKTLHGKKVFVIGYAALIVCLDDDITLEVVEAIAKLKDEYKSEITRVVFKDSSFENAVVKTNALQVLKQFEIDEVVSV